MPQEYYLNVHSKCLDTGACACHHPMIGWHAPPEIPNIGETPMVRSLARSNAHFRKALTRLPLGVASNFRYWGEERTIYVERGKGGRIWDLDGNEYVDHRLGYGPVI